MMLLLLVFGVIAGAYSMGLDVSAVAQRLDSELLTVLDTGSGGDTGTEFPKRSNTSRENDSERVDGMAGSVCAAYLENGAASEKADIVLVMKDYASDTVMMDDVAYFMDLDADNRGLFNIEPMKSHQDKFNVWVVDAGDTIADYNDPRTGRGLVQDAADWFAVCPFAEYNVVLAKEGMGRSGFTLSGNRMFVKDVHRKVLNDQGAAGLIHEWGHGFGGLKDEYYTEGGRDASGKPNCADSRAAAEEWWGDLADTHPDVGFYQGCAYNTDNWRPHEKSIMGNGGIWSYGPVNERHMEGILEQYE